MSEDQRVTMAREFLAGARQRNVAELPLSVLMREGAELRRLLGKALDVIADYEDTEPDDSVTQLTSSGGASIAPGDALVLRGALADAIAHRDPGFCADCDRSQDGLCPDHVKDEQQADAYLALARELGIEAGA